MLSNFSTRASSFIEPRSRPAWIAILMLVFVITVGILVHLDSITRILYICGCFSVGAFLYVKYPFMYISFAFWTYFLTPFVTRLVDLQSGYDPLRTMIIAPELVMLLTSITFFRYLPKFYYQGGSYFIAPVIAIVYATLIGLINGFAPFLVGKTFIGWINGILLGFHLLVNWQNYPKYRQTIQRTFLWSCLIMGIYGIYQYLVLPDWDKLWLIQSEMYTSAGNPEPQQIRVWSTLHSPGAFASAITGILLILLSCQGSLSLAANASGYLAFLLTLVRSSWGGWFVGLLTFIPSLKPRLQIRLFVAITLLCICILPFATMSVFSERIAERFSTLSDIESDGSFQGRKELFGTLLNKALAQVVGFGFGAQGQDNGLITMLFLFGWLGSIPYFIGVINLGKKLFQNFEHKSDLFLSATRSVVFSQLVQIVFGAPFAGLPGWYIWGFGGMFLAGQRYHRNLQQRASAEENEIEEL
jgi:hypothetical protein